MEAAEEAEVVHGREHAEVEEAADPGLTAAADGQGDRATSIRSKVAAVVAAAPAELGCE